MLHCLHGEGEPHAGELVGRVVGGARQLDEEMGQSGDSAG
jgi:hypothetical protein